MAAPTAVKRQAIIGTKLEILTGTGAPVDGVIGTGTGAGRAKPGSFYIDTTDSLAQLYVNKGTKASPVWKHSTTIVSKVATAGSNGAGAVTLTGARVGDRVVAVLNLTDLTDDASKFETTITVADQIQQTSATNLSAKKFFVQMVH